MPDFGASNVQALARRYFRGADIEIRLYRHTALQLNIPGLVLERSVRYACGSPWKYSENINQIAKAVSGGGEVPGSLRGESWAMLKICSALRDNTKALLKANQASWAAGHTRGDNVSNQFD
jgi:hypothetical protein